MALRAGARVAMALNTPYSGAAGYVRTGPRLEGDAGLARRGDGFSANEKGVPGTPFCLVF